MSRAAFALDTSNYTTSVALFAPEGAFHSARLLDVPEGALGLRQSDALFMHVKRLPELVSGLMDRAGECDIRAVGASTRPRPVDGSYMPCFLAGESQGRSLAAALGVPFHAFSHQDGHLAAALWSAGRMELFEKPFLAWHLSGGTTELLFVKPDGAAFLPERIGGSEDLSAGQLIDRTGKLLGLPFPSGKALDALASAVEKPEFFKPKLRGLEFSLSGLENKTREFHEKGAPAGETAAFAIAGVCAAVRDATLAALRQYGGLPVVFSGGVASNSMLRAAFSDAAFAEPQYSTDNAMGVALLTARREALI